MRKLWPKYENWSKQENQNRLYRYKSNLYRYKSNLYRYKSNLYRYKLAKNDQNRSCTGTSSNCTGTSHSGMPRMCVFSPIFSCFDIQSTLHFKHTSKPFKFTLKSIFYSIHLSMDIFLPNSFMNHFQRSFQHGSQPIPKSNMMII